MERTPDTNPAEQTDRPAHQGACPNASAAAGLGSLSNRRCLARRVRNQLRPYTGKCGPRPWSSFCQYAMGEIGHVEIESEWTTLRREREVNVR